MVPPLSRLSFSGGAARPTRACDSSLPPPPKSESVFFAPFGGSNRNVSAGRSGSSCQSLNVFVTTTFMSFMAGGTSSPPCFITLDMSVRIRRTSVRSPGVTHISQSKCSCSKLKWCASAPSICSLPTYLADVTPTSMSSLGCFFRNAPMGLPGPLARIAKPPSPSPGSDMSFGASSTEYC